MKQKERFAQIAEAQTTDLGRLMQRNLETIRCFDPAAAEIYARFIAVREELAAHFGERLETK